MEVKKLLKSIDKIQGVNKRLLEELGKLQVAINETKARRVDLKKGESFGLMGFDMRQVVT